MHVDNDQSVYSDLLLLCQRLPYKLNEVIELISRFFKVINDFVWLDSLFYQSSPPNLWAIKDALSGVVASPFCSFCFWVFIDRIFELISNRCFHHIFYLIHPVFYIFLIRIDVFDEVNFFLLCWKHSDDLFLIVELDRINIFKDFLEMRLHSCGLLGLWKNLQKIVVWKKVESCKFLSLFLQVFV
jgi:hypothetical protein